MTNININKKYLLKELGKNLSDEQLRELISLMGTDPDEISGDEIVVEVFPNRPDLLSGYSITRALKQFSGKSPGFINYAAKSPKKDYKVIVDKSVKTIRPYTACAIVSDLKLDNLKILEIIQLQEKLHLTFGRDRKKLAIGIYPLEKIKLPIHYRADKPDKIKFQPLESDHEMTGAEILRKHPTGIKYAALLESAEKYPYFIDSNNEILSMPPIINSEKTGRVSESTHEVFIECSGFDYDVLSKCLNIIVTVLADMGGEIHQMNLEYDNKKRISPDLSPEKLAVNIDYINSVIGVNLDSKTIKNSLEKMGHGVEIKGKNINVKIPCYRTDILHKIDIVEDIAIGYGYQNFIPEIPKVASTAQENKTEYIKDRLRDILVGFGFIELKNYDIINSEFQTKLIYNKEKPVMIISPVSAEYDSLRTNVLSSILQSLKFNLRNESNASVFELGTVFHHDKSEETNVSETEHLAIMLSSSSVNFTSIKQVLATLMRQLNKKFSLEELDEELFIAGRSGTIIINNKKLGKLGEISPKVINNFELRNPCAFLELDLSFLE